jgi:uncharacterized protein YycO
MEAWQAARESLGWSLGGGMEVGWVKILLYRGVGWVSRVIQWQTRSPYSHAAVQLSSGKVIEAWHVGGVRMLDSPFDGHAKGTEIDVFGVRGGFNPPAVEDFLLKQIGKRYDFLSVARFVSRRDAPDDDRWFCSELVVAAFRMGSLSLLAGPPSYISPRDLRLSPCLIPYGTLR